jgi:hypothetical protein
MMLGGHGWEKIHFGVVAWWEIKILRSCGRGKRKEGAFAPS